MIQLKKSTFLFIILQLLDIVSTAIAINMGFGIYESNRLLHLGWVNLIVIKVVGIVFGSLILQFGIKSKHLKIIPISMCVFIVVWNIMVIFVEVV